MQSVAWSPESKVRAFASGPILDAVLVQAGWWACVLGASRGWFFFGPAIVAGLIVVQTRRLPVDARRRTWRNVLVLGAAGTVIDSLQGSAGLLIFRGAPVAWLAPLWITALWCHLATVLPAFAPLRSRPLVAGLLGAIGGPLAYAAGTRLGAASLHPEPWLSLVVIAAVWAVALPAMIRALLPASAAEATPASNGAAR